MSLPTYPERGYNPRPRHIDLIEAMLQARAQELFPDFPRHGSTSSESNGTQSSSSPASESLPFNASRRSTMRLSSYASESLPYHPSRRSTFRTSVYEPERPSPLDLSAAQSWNTSPASVSPPFNNSRRSTTRTSACTTRGPTPLNLSTTHLWHNASPPLPAEISPQSSPQGRPRKHRYSMWTSKNDEKIPTGAEVKEVSATPTPEPPDQSSSLSTARQYLFIFNVCLAQLFSLAALAQTFAPLMIITESFNVTDPGQMSWYTAAYSMILGTFILPSGRLGDMFGHKTIFMIGWVWFSVWSMICGFSYLGGPIMLSACRGMQGLGPALLIPNGIALVGRNFPVGMKRNVAIALFGGCGPLGIVVGAVASSLFAQLIWWPWAFWFFAIACVGAGLLSAIVIPSDDVRPPALIVRAGGPPVPESFDILGAVTGVSGLILINFSLNQAPLVGWAEPYIPTLLCAGFLLMALFVYVELHIAQRPIVPLRGLHKDAALTLIVIAVGWASHGIWVYYLFLLFEDVRGLSALSTCKYFWPVAPTGFCAALAVPFLLKKVRVPILMSASMLFFLTGTVLLATAPADQSYWGNTFVSILIMPLAMNWSFPSGTILMSNAVPKKHQGIAASLITTMVNYSISTGLGAAGSIDRYVSPSSGRLGGYRAAWYLGIGLAVTGLFISFYFIWRSRPRR